ncbi:MAG: carboxypeptidase regulatory-like domain-containing protein [Alphaproteobacteria bacterium]|nr:carboxypeptidase regulatory-like domain-containing protein [Alphaproteobacteria bacterium]MCB9931141.1 carboxypeptidase regulatory-like domain-containing protein [Alphaproteobacteria bacterium]
MTRIYEPFGGPTQPDLRTQRYFRTTTTAPAEPLIPLPRTLTETSGPAFDARDLGGLGTDISNNNTVLGSLMVVAGQVTDEDGRPVPNALVEVWQANASGKYPHEVDARPAPQDPNFTGAARMLTDAEGRYRFTTIKPGAYPVPNTGNWWRPPHIHFSLYGEAFASRLISQMFFPGEPLNAIDGILQAIPDAAARTRLIARPDESLGIHEMALGFRFDIVLRGRNETPMVD